MATYTISSQPFYDNINQCYKNIVIIDREPTGPLAQIVKSVFTHPGCRRLIIQVLVVLWTDA